MADVFKISDATALALHSLVHLTLNPSTRPTTTEIAEVFRVSRHHLAKVHQRLTKEGIIRSHRGPAGGVELAKDPATLSILEVYEVMEGPMLHSACLFNREECHREDCVLGKILPVLARTVRDYFEGTTLAQLAEDSKKGTD